MLSHDATRSRASCRAGWESPHNQGSSAQAGQGQQRVAASCRAVRAASASRPWRCRAWHDGWALDGWALRLACWRSELKGWAEGSDPDGAPGCRWTAGTQVTGLGSQLSAGRRGGMGGVMRRRPPAALPPQTIPSPASRVLLVRRAMPAHARSTSHRSFPCKCMPGRHQPISDTFHVTWPRRRALACGSLNQLR